MGKTIRFVVYALTMGILYAVINYLNTRDNIGGRAGEDELHYVVRIPLALKAVYFSMFVVGMFLFIVFLFFKVNKNPTITVGHLRFALIFAGIGLVVMFLSTKWRIAVNEDQMKVHPLFGMARTVQISDIERAETGEKGQIEIYVDGKKLTTVDGLTDNFDRFRKTLISCGKLRQ